MNLIWHKNPDEAVRKNCVYLEQVRKKEGQTAYWNLVRPLLKSDPWFLMRVALEWAWLDEDLVGCAFIRHIAENWGEDLGILFPRGHGKTLPMSAIVIACILNNPNTAILEISRTDDNADKFGALVGQELMYNDYLQRCFGVKHNEKDGFLPSAIGETTLWGKDGYTLPRRKPRLDPTLLCISLRSAKAGKHPDWIYIDDPTEEENNDPAGWEKVTKVIDGCKFLLPADGHFVWCGTRWHDGDPLGLAERGKLKGKQGAFNFIKYSCYVDDNPLKPPTYPRKIRWNMTKPTGYTQELLDEMRKSKDEGGLGEFFDAQMRNDPLPVERADIRVKDINIYEPKELPKCSYVRAMGIETTGGGLPIYNGLREKSEELRFFLPLHEITNPRRVGITKRDRIVAALQPITSSGRLYAQKWMIGEADSMDTLGYELRRLGKATHDDIADALHNVPAHLVNQCFPKEGEEAHVYISVDLAYSEEKRADWTVCMAVAVDHKCNYWVIDYDRFQLSSPTAIYDRLIAFYRKFVEEEKVLRTSRNKYPGVYR